MFRCCCVCLTLLFSGAILSPAVADDGSKPVTYTDVSEAGPDYQIQGEYEGEFEVNGDATKVGFQVIALGEENFRGIAMLGGLPGDGWDGFTKLEAEGTRNEDGLVVLEAAEGTAEVKDGKIIVKSLDGQELGTLERVERKSPTLGMKPPEGAVVLFDGTTSENFEGGKMTEEEFLMAGCKSKQSFDGDFTLHIEFRTPFMPTARSQQRGNSGVYLQERYEVQMLDSFGLEGLHNECGGIYSLHDPNENMCFPPLTWQTYDIDFTAAKFDDAGMKTDNAKITVRHNGVVVHDNFELKSETPGGKPEGPGGGAFLLQDHGNPVVYRNIWVEKK